MRLSVFRDSPYYNEQMIFLAEIFVDGVRVSLCVEACEEEGWADMYETDDAGTVGPDLVRMKGKVEIVI
jgi:hypothetical protein